MGAIFMASALVPITVRIFFMDTFLFRAKVMSPLLDLFRLSI